MFWKQVSFTQAVLGAAFSSMSLFFLIRKLLGFELSIVLTDLHEFYRDLYVEPVRWIIGLIGMVPPHWYADVLVFSLVCAGCYFSAARAAGSEQVRSVPLFLFQLAVLTITLAMPFLALATLATHLSETDLKIQKVFRVLFTATLLGVLIFFALNAYGPSISKT